MSVENGSQPDWGPSQVRTAEELRLGVTYWYNTVVLGPRTGDTYTFIISARVYKFEVLNLPQNGEQFISVQLNDGKRSPPTKISLADLGFTPYADGKWSRWDWVEGPSKTQASQNGHRKVSLSLILSCH